MSRFLQFLIRGYQVTISPFLGGHCRFTPTCSAYAMEALERHGVARPGDHVAVLVAELPYVTMIEILTKVSPFTAEEVATLER